jgi:hypothetical protein
MKIEKYISQLLYRYQCVTVPSFGAFLTETQSAQLHEETDTFSPPRKVISFNSNIRNNDGLLANHVAQSENVQYEVAVQAILNQVTGWKNYLQNFGSFSIENVGELFLNSENSLVFVSTNQFNYLTSSFGLTSYVSPAVKRENAVFEPINEKPVVILVPEIKKEKSYLKYAAILVLGTGMLAGSVFFGNQLYQSNIQNQTLLAEKRVQDKVNQKIQEATFVIQNPLPDVTLNLAEKTTPYHIVAGAFKVSENAQKKLRELKNKGYNARIIAPNKHGLSPVLYGSFSSYAEAHNAMQKIKKAHNNEAWLLIQE